MSMQSGNTFVVVDFFFCLFAYRAKEESILDGIVLQCLLRASELLPRPLSSPHWRFFYELYHCSANLATRQAVAHREPDGELQL
eukprot:gene8378-5867_t